MRCGAAGMRGLGLLDQLLAVSRHRRSARSRRPRGRPRNTRLRRSSRRRRPRWSTSTCARACRPSCRRSPTIRCSAASSARRFGMPQERIQNSLGSGVIVARRRHRRHQHPRRQGRRRGRDPHRAGRPARVRRQGAPAGREVRHRRAQDRGRRRPLSLPGVRGLRHPRGRRHGAGDRQPVRRRPDRDQRHHLGAGAHGGRQVGRRRCSSRPTPPSIPATPAAR